MIVKSRLYVDEKNIKPPDAISTAKHRSASVKKRIHNHEKLFHTSFSIAHCRLPTWHFAAEDL